MIRVQALFDGQRNSRMILFNLCTLMVEHVYVEILPGRMESINVYAINDKCNPASGPQRNIHQKSENRAACK